MLNADAFVIKPSALDHVKRNINSLSHKCFASGFERWEIRKRTVIIVNLSKILNALRPSAAKRYDRNVSSIFSLVAASYSLKEKTY